MPGLDQLKKFNSDMLNLGDEVKIRSTRGEKPVLVPIPKGVSAENDSEDFRFGMPEISQEEQDKAKALAEQREKDANDFSDIIGEPSSAEEVPDVQPLKAPDVSDLLDTNVSSDDIDLSDFEDPAPAEQFEEVPIEDLDLDALLASTSGVSEDDTLDGAGNLENEVPAATFGADDLTELGLDSFADETPSALDDDFDSDLSSSLSMNDTIPNEFNEVPLNPVFGNDSAEVPDDLIGADSFGSGFDDELPVMEDFGGEDFKDMGEVSGADEALSLDDALSVPDAPAGSVDSVDTGLPGFGEIPSVSDDLESFDVDSLLNGDDSAEQVGLSVPEEITSASSVSEELPDFDDVPSDVSRAEVFSGAELPADDSADSEAGDVVLDDNMLAGMSFDEPSVENESVSEPSEEPASESFDDLGLGDIDALSNFTEPSSETEELSAGTSDVSGKPAETSSAEEPASADVSDISASDIDDIISGMVDPGFGDDDAPSGPEISDEQEVPASESESPVQENAGGADDDLFSMDFPSLDEELTGKETVPDVDDSSVEVFDVPELDDMDLASGSSDFEFGNNFATEGENDDDDDFSIEGFTNVDTVEFGKPSKPAAAASLSAGEEENEKKPKNTFTDAEYKKFLKNLEEYPLNVRIALEDLIVRNEFTDDAVFEILEKVLRKVSARQLASDLEKMLDVSLDVPRDFERRSASEYEAYKKSVEYQLKNRIIPAAILSAAAALVITFFGFLIKYLVWNPLQANKFYKQGYALIDQNQYAMSEDSFNKAVDYRPVENWFFRYADKYRDHKQYDRARKMYKSVIFNYDHDKRAGMDWADMEMYEVQNYPETERILKREVLDYHINDSDAILKLGDLYMLWGDEDEEKYELAKENYDLLMELYGNGKMYYRYQARLMRYYICMDNLRQVLMYKDFFYPEKLRYLEAEDYTNLSGFLLDKRFGKLNLEDESLRSAIEDVRDLLVKATEKDSRNPISYYNFGRYSVYTDNNRDALAIFNVALDKFKSQKSRTRKETYAYIDTYRLVGEQYAGMREYIKAQENYSDAINLFEKQADNSAFKTNSNIGKLYADLGDVNYFITGDMDAAIDNYIKSVGNKNDTPSVRYRIGYIQYNREEYDKAWGSFTEGLEANDTDVNLLLALSNTLSKRNDNLAAQGYYQRLLDRLQTEFGVYTLITPQVREDQYDLVNTYLKASNNMGVTLYRLGHLRSDSDMNGRSIVYLQESNRAWDILTRNQKTMVRLEGSNLAEQNIKYVTNSSYGYEPVIYADISKTLFGEEELEK